MNGFINAEIQDATCPAHNKSKYSETMPLCTCVFPSVHSIAKRYFACARLALFVTCYLATCMRDIFLHHVALQRSAAQLPTAITKLRSASSPTFPSMLEHS